VFFFFFQAEDGIRDRNVTGVQTCALPISPKMKPIDMAKEPFCARLHAAAPVLTENAVTGPGNALRWVLVYVSAGDQGSAPSTEPVRLDQRGCQYIPHVLVLQPNQPLDIYNDD